MSTTKKIAKLYLQYKRYVVLLIVGIPIISKLDVWSQTMLGAIIDSIASLDAWFSTVGVYALAVVLLFVAKQMYSIIEQILSFHVVYDLRAKISEKVLRIKSESLSSYSAEEIMHMWNQDVQEIQSVSVKSILNFLILFFSAVLALLELREISVWFPLIALVVNILAILPVKVIGKKNRKWSEKERESQIEMNEKFYTILNAIRLVKSYGKEMDEIEEFKKKNSVFVDDKLASSLASRIYKSVSDAVKSIAPTLILIIANFQIRDGRMTIGDIVLAISLLGTVNKPFRESGNFFIDLKGIFFKFDSLFQFLEKEDEQSKGVIFDFNIPYEFEFEHVSYRMNDVGILEDINLTIEAGEKVAIVGESGSGKTTLNNLLLRICTPTSGRILMRGRDIHELDLYTYRKGIHYSQSNTYVMNGTIMQNLTLLGAEEDACIQAAEAIGFHEEIMAMADGYDTVVDASGSNISGGQKKKIAIIRALTKSCNLYVLDELTRGIDEAHALAIMNYLLDHILSTTIFTMHNFCAIERMDKIIVMKAGRVIAQGRHQELYQSCDYYRKLYDNRRRTGNG